MRRTLALAVVVFMALFGLALGGLVSGAPAVVSAVGPAADRAWADDVSPRRPVAPPRPDREVLPSPCTVAVTDAVGAGPLPACRQTPVTVTLAVSCPVRLPLHVVLVVGNHLAMQDHLDEVKRAARAVVNGLDFDAGTQAGVVTLSAQARRQLDLSDRRAPVLAAINRIQLDPINPFVRYYDWIGEAERMLEEGRQEGPPALEVVVVYSTGCPNGFESYCSRQIASAGKAKGSGITVIGVCNPNARPFGFPLPAGHCRTLRQMSTSGYYHTLQQAGRTSMDLEELVDSGKDLMVDALTFLESVAPGLHFVPGSAVPPAVEDGSDLTFQWPDLSPGTVVTATYRLSPTTPGTVTLRAAGSQVRLADSLGRGGGPWPVATRVLTLTSCAVATPSPSATASATPPTEPSASSTPPPVATSRPGRAWLPVALQRACRAGLAPMDVVLAMDASTSMNEASGGTTKLAAAKAAAVRFVDFLAPRRDRAAVVVFNRRAMVVAPLGSDAAAVEAALAQVTSAPGTNIAAALARSRGVLAAPAPGASGRPAIVLLTDGRPDPGTRDQVLAEAALARKEGVTVVAVGLGDGADEGLLRLVATRPDLYRPAADAAALPDLYEAIVAELPCPGGGPWRRAAMPRRGRPGDTTQPPEEIRDPSGGGPISWRRGAAAAADLEPAAIQGAVGGVIGALATGGDTLYAGVGAKVLRYLPAGQGVAEDATSPVLPGVVRDVAAEGDRLLVAQDQGLLVFIDAGAAGLEPVLGVPTLSRAQRVAVDEGFAYALVSGQPGVLVLDVRDPEPRGAGTGLPQVQGRDLAAGQRRLYVTTGDGLVVADVAIPGTPRLLGEIPDLPGAAAVEVAGDALYVAVDGGVWSFDVSGLAPEARGFAAAGGQPVGLAVAGTTVAATTAAGRLVVIDFTDPEEPTVAGDIDLGDRVGPVALAASTAGHRAYVGGARGIHVVTIGNGAPGEQALVPGFEVAWDVAAGDTAWYAALGDGGLGVFRGTGRYGRRLSLRGMMPLGGDARRVAAHGLFDRAAVVLEQGRVVFADASRPEAMTVTGRLEVTARDVALGSRDGYLTAGTELVRFELRPDFMPVIVDRISDPEWDLDELGWARNEGVLFVTDRNFGLRVFSATGGDPRRVSEVAFSPPQYSQGLAIDLSGPERLVHVAAGNPTPAPERIRSRLALGLDMPPPPELERVLTFDVSNATRPRLVDSGAAFGWPRGIAVADGRRWVASGLTNGSSGRLRIDGGPAAAASVPLPAVPGRLNAWDAQALIADGEAGLLAVHDAHPVTPSPTAVTTATPTATALAVTWRQFLPRVFVAR